MLATISTHTCVYTACAPCVIMPVSTCRRICDGSSYPWNDIRVRVCVCMMDQPISTEAG